MSDSYFVDPDVGFIKEVSQLGGQDLKKCFQCATCSVACPISPDTKPFPRKEMIAASWGLKDRLVGSADIWLCHNCGDCTALCPRGAKPGDVLGALRAYAISEYGAPKILAKSVNDPKKLVPLALLPAVLFLVVGFLCNILFGVQWLNFRPGGDTIVHANFFSTWLVDIIFIPTFFFAVVVFALGLKRFVADIHANALLEGKTTKEKIDPVGFVQALVRTVPTILQHKKFTECGENKERATPHMMVLFSFIALFIVTNIFFVSLYIFGQHGPYSQLNPVKWLANVGGIALIIGSGMMIIQRLSNKEQVSSYKDWWLLGLVFGLGVTGMLAQLTRLGGLAGVSYFIYFVHLMFVWYLFAYTPFSKLAHLVYRTVAMTYLEWSGRK
ncbi:quinone-interacting membrane-bound oxidoreductase complex subunit QmoC [Desulfatitalea alkaliphila]|uniref:Quinone-interacting membrane-bound oxidoreductase complex subunit QmoC n=1 Tax=Desulfatitalea alkaliphila TaxID=2929485 RepID=A0AA41QZN8_9BACT|nr:quinone-interacting membrane-bound oxidoreductase complex subunit QmoC [Desulfatitalea alkaliphila]MCJ8499338.1 quinone-interacting membrane-bound oxidoreductase complex subunit QmoC [Desulfatitalea alkaliphila]